VGRQRYQGKTNESENMKNEKISLIGKKSRRMIYIFSVIVLVAAIGVTYGLCWLVGPPLDKETKDLIKQYGYLQLTDVHNHDADCSRYLFSKFMWEKYNVNRVVLFGRISDPKAVSSDINAWSAYIHNPDLIIPYFSGFDLHDK
jgi:hypothetical protein